MAEPLQPGRERVLRSLVRRVVAARVRSSRAAYHYLRRLEEGYVGREGGRVKMSWPAGEEGSRGRGPR
jgi:hypothetical protein